MKIKGYVYAAITLIITVYLIYFVQFYFVLGYEVSNDSADWGQLGDYAGGVLNPLLSFVTIVLLIKSLSLQHEANSSLRKEIKNSEKIEKLRSFEVLFFNLISAQKDLFESFKIKITEENTTSNQLVGTKAVIAIEEKIEAMRKSGETDQEITDYLSDLDEHDQIFGVSRAFYILVMVVTEKLSDANGFSSGDRSAHYKTLVNFTDFAQLRLVMMCVQFMDYEPTKYIRTSHEFTNIVGMLGLSYEMY
jgi:hypothetical protein